MIYNNDSVRVLERESIRAFVSSCSNWLTGRVIDVGSGKQPYRSIVEAAGGTYFPYDSPALPGSTVFEAAMSATARGSYDACLLNQVLQFVPDPPDFMNWIRSLVIDGGVFVCTYTTNWVENEPGDLHRFTQKGMERLVSSAGFTILRSERRAEINLNGFRLSLGGGIAARAT